MSGVEQPSRRDSHGPLDVVRVAAGNFLEMYDFMVFGYYAAAIGKAFFPTGDPFATLMLALMTFGAGFLMRPIGAVVLGAYTDRHGRRKGFYVSWQSASQQVAVVTAAGIGALLAVWLTPRQMGDFGWRIPLLFGCAIAPFIFLLRRSLKETQAFRAMRVPPSLARVCRDLVGHWKAVLTGMALATMTTVSFYMITAYTPTFGGLLKLPAGQTLVVTACVGLSNLVWLPVMGAVSDRLGRRPVLIACTIAALLTAYPAMAWLASSPSFGRMLTVELWLSFVYASYNGAMVVFLTEIIPAEVRASGFSLAYSLATAIFGGFTPAIATGLIHVTGNHAMPGAWLSVAAALGLAAALVAKPARPLVGTG